MSDSETEHLLNERVDGYRIIWIRDVSKLLPSISSDFAIPCIYMLSRTIFMNGRFLKINYDK